MNSNIRIIIGSLAVIGAMAGTVACQEQPAPVSKKADHSKVVVKDKPAAEPSTDVVVEEPTETATPEITPEPADTTAKVGDTVQVGDWSVTVTEVVLNANDVIRKANMYNDKPKGQYVLVTYNATYTGDERTADVDMDLTWTMTGSDNKVVDNAYAVDPSDEQSWSTEARKGGTVTQQVNFDINPAVLTGAILSVEGYTADYDTVYADFSL
jgi:hypothetical protein